MIKTFEDLAEATFSKLANDFESVRYVVALFSDVLVLVVIESIVVYPIGRRWRTFGSFSIVNIEPIDDIVVEDFCFLIFKQVFGEVQNSLAWIHREF